LVCVNFCYLASIVMGLVFSVYSALSVRRVQFNGVSFKLYLHINFSQELYRFIGGGFVSDDKKS
jgi:hypothetical protein